jgi:outer membrane protein TolC
MVGMVLAAVVVGQHARAGEEIGPESTLEDLVAYAEAHNPGLRSFRARHAAALERVSEAGGLPDPRLDVAWAVVPIETRVGPQHGRITLAQSLPWTGKRPAAVDAARASAEEAARAYEAARSGLELEVARAYFGLYLLHRSIEITRDNRDLLVYLEQAVRKAYETGGGSYAGLLRVQVEIGTIENDLRSLVDQLRPARAGLNALLHRAPDADLPTPALPAHDGSTPTGTPWTEADTSSAPDLLVYDARVDAAERGITVADLSDRPDWTVFLSYFPTGNAIDPAMPDSGKDPVVLGVSVGIPLWGKKNRATRNRAQSLRDATVVERAAAEDRLRDRVETSSYRLRNADRETRLYRDTLLPKAEQTLEASLAGFRAGTVDVLDIVEAQQVLLRFRLTMERALAERARGAAELRALLGDGSTASGKGESS